MKKNFCCGVIVHPYLKVPLGELAVLGVYERVLEATVIVYPLRRSNQ